MISRMQANIRTLLDISVTAAFGDCFRGLTNLNNAYQRAMLCSRFRLYSGNGGIFHEANIGKEKNPGLTKERDLIVSSAKDDDLPFFLSRLNSIFSALQKTDYEEGINFVAEFILALQKIAEDLGWRNHLRGQDNLVALINRIESLENREELKSLLTDTFRIVTDYLNEANHLEAGTLIGDARNYIEENYSNGQLSGAMVARECSMTPQYFSKLFSDQTGQSFPQYLNHIRMERARVLLTESNKPAQDIAEEVGYYNRSYFSTLFKKTYGVSPARYRLSRSKKQITE